MIAGKVSSASVTVVDAMVSSGEVGTDDTLSFFAGTTAGDKKGFRKMTIDKDNLIVYDSSDSTTNIFKVENGLRIAQMVLCPVIEANLSEVEIIDETERGEGGFGSTGTK